LRRSQDVIGLPVIHVQTGKRLGTVCDLLFDEQQRLRGVLLECGGWMRRGRYIPAERVGFGADAVVVNSEALLKALDEQQSRWTGLLTGQHHLKGRSVMSDDGNELGAVENVYFHEKLGTLLGYELSEGMLTDWRHGRKVFQPPVPLIWGGDVLISPSAGQLADV
jgi:uncharacterized protein YrrD